MFEVSNIYGFNKEDRKIVSFSLWGKNPKYTVGAIKNAELAKKFYPEWRARFYCGSDVDIDTIHELKNRDAQVYVMKDVGSWNGMFWRFLPPTEKENIAFISRDCDSRISQREVDAVNAWLEEPEIFHVMRDHPYHAVPMLGGMWGCKGYLAWLKSEMENFDKTDRWQTDQDFLKAVVWPRVGSVLEHDEFFRKNEFPTKRKGLEFVGEAFDENGKPNEEHRHILWQNL